MRRKELISIWRSRWVYAPSLALAIHAWFPTPAVGTGANQDLPVVYRVAEQPRLQIGSVDDHTTGLFRVTHAIRLRDGRILIADGGAAELKFFDARGNHLRLTGREGDGPGEFRGLQRIAELDDGRIAALDILLRRVTVFSPEGELDHTRPVTEESDELGLREPLAYGVLADGTLVGIAEVEGAGVERRYGDYPSSVLTYRAPIVQPVLIDSLGVAAALGPPLAGSATVREMRSTTTAGRIHISGGSVSPPFVYTLLVAVRGASIALGPTDEYLVGTLDADGTLHVVSAEAPRQPIREGAREAWVDGWVARFSSRREQREWRGRYEAFLASDVAPETLPPFKSLALQEGGRVWMEVYDPAHEEGQPSSWIVAEPSRRGDLEGVVELPPGFEPHDIGADYVLGVWRDELGIEYVRLYDLIEVPSGE